MRQKVNDLALELMFQEILKLRGTDMSDKERDFVVKVFQATEEDMASIEDDDLEGLSSEYLEGLILNELPAPNNSPEQQESQQEGDPEDPVAQA